MAPQVRIRLANELSLADIIEQWSACYDLAPTERRFVVNRTVNAAIDDQHLGINDDPQISLFGLLDRFAAEVLTHKAR
ncbi:MAG: hypothetical protein ACT6RF_09105 [Allorhizobium sp.]|uniref:hypothetical protein n=1 Tax=Allorhizobium sp. TaxID=633478 RepID=UPI004034A3CE